MIPLWETPCDDCKHLSRKNKYVHKIQNEIGKAKKKESTKKVVCNTGGGGGGGTKLIHEKASRYRFCESLAFMTIIPFSSSNLLTN